MVIETASEKKMGSCNGDQRKKQSSFIHPFNINLLTIRDVLEWITMSKVVKTLRSRLFGNQESGPCRLERTVPCGSAGEDATWPEDYGGEE